MSFKLMDFRLFAILGLATCVASQIDYERATPAFCGDELACEEVSHSFFGSILGVPLPVLGIVAFASFVGTSLFPDRPAVRYLGPMAILAGLVGLGLLLIQAFLIRRLCPLCLLIDALAMVIAAVELGTRPLLPTSISSGTCLAWVIVAILGVIAPVTWSTVHPPPPVPQVVKTHWCSGKITIVKVTDFTCIHCRRTHVALSEFRKQRGDEVKFVRLVKPLRRHVHSEQAARTYRFAAAKGKADEMADALFSASDLTDQGCENLTLAIGLDLTEYRVFLASPETDRTMIELKAEFEWAHSLPIICVQERLLNGEQSRQALERAYQRASR